MSSPPVPTIVGSLPSQLISFGAAPMLAALAPLR
jgi:hypothetical protein